MVDGKWQDNPKVVKSEFFLHFRKRFEKPSANRILIDMNFPKTISIDQQTELEGAVSKEEVKKAVWDCGSDKSPGPDGFSVIKAIYGDDGEVNKVSKYASRSCWRDIINEVRKLNRSRGIGGVFCQPLCGNIIDDQELLTVDSKTLWIKSVPIKVNILAWKIKLEALPTRFNISRRGIEIDSILCPICDRGTYIVYMGDVPKGDISAASLHTNMLQQVIGSRASKSLLRSYTRSFNGFAAKLSEDEKNQIARE
ncbi:RNA-directed DNA polymerase, eukaryota [Tanacetum coccineum]